VNRLVQHAHARESVLGDVPLENLERVRIGLEADYRRGGIQPLEEEDREPNVAPDVQDDRLRILGLEIVVLSHEDLLEHLHEPVVIEEAHGHVEDPRPLHPVPSLQCRDELLQFEARVRRQQRAGPAPVCLQDPGDIPGGVQL
jgi:hypothetical protein